MNGQEMDNQSCRCPSGLLEPGRHFFADASTLGNSPVLRIIKTGIGDLQSTNTGLDGRQRSGETGRANRLRVSQTSDMRRHHIAIRDGRIEQLHESQGLGHETRIVSGEFRMGCGHVVRNIHNGIAGRPQLRKFDDAGNLESRIGNIHPEVRRNRTQQPEHHADNTNVYDPVVELALLWRHAGKEPADEWYRNCTNNFVGIEVSVAGSHSPEFATRPRYSQALPEKSNAVNCRRV